MAQRAYVNPVKKQNDLRLGNVLVSGLLPQKMTWFSSVFSNPNLLANPDFRINQRGGKIVIDGCTVDGYENCDWSYSFDRWRITTNNEINKTYYKDGALHATGIAQYIENPERFIGLKMTLSCCGADGTVYSGVSDYIHIEDPWWSLGFCGTENCSARLYTNAGQLCLGVAGVVKWVKLELGEVATRYIPPDPGLELERCKRYYEPIDIFDKVDADSKNLIWHIFTFTIEKRISEWKFVVLDFNAWFIDTGNWENVNWGLLSADSWKSTNHILIVASLPRNMTQYNIRCAVDAEIY